jgi:hypothetical protein
MNESNLIVNLEHLPFYITGPGETDALLLVVAVFLIGVVVTFHLE